ncbi:MAG: undecaprenyl/decaprenyl-phosphate alpha-N-acetylglucosaminyl 1-phosphate transferase [candidate division NC10 bacterium]|nr:undecaprenyl/decaprenyl-phosphate alpha-N-acetylglucosaminyl 1-phosphate transferase [candidate division NC10 bacterium]
MTTPSSQKVELTLHWYASVGLFLLLLLPPVRDTWFSQYGRRWLYILSFSFCLSSLLLPFARVLALRLRILDHPAGRKIHTNPTPLLGGIPIFIALTGSILANSILDREMAAILIGAALLTFTGLLDDAFTLPARLKLLAQLLATALVLLAGVELTLFPPVWWGRTGNILLTIFWITGITNALNFMDGMDGLAAGLGVITAGFMGLVAFQTNQPLMGWLSAAVVGSCLGFLPYNFRPKAPASIFLGDAGSTFLGFTLASLAVKGSWAESSIIDIAAPILIFGVLIFDMIHLTVARLMSGRVKDFRGWLEYVGQDHLHHRIAVLLGSTRQSVLFIYLLSICLGLAAIALRRANAIDALVLILQAAIIVVIVTILERRGNKRLR